MEKVVTMIPNHTRTTHTSPSRARGTSSRPNYTFDALPDPADFRDLLFSPTLVEVPLRMRLEDYQAHQVPVLDQGQEGACTGFALATVANYLLRRRKADPDTSPDITNVSPRMLYTMAKRYDEWPGEEYSGSSARGAMKGWHRHGICSDELWPDDSEPSDWAVSAARSHDALRRTLGAYYRVDGKDIVAMHSALAEVGILFATARVHEGWYEPDDEFSITPSLTTLGGHAFAIVAYDEYGFWIQNSWGTAWGHEGFARLYYDDWLAHGLDVWVARLGVEIRFRWRQGPVDELPSQSKRSRILTTYDVSAHTIGVGNDGRLCGAGGCATSEADVRQIFEGSFYEQAKSWKKKRLLLYAHGGLVSERDATTQAANLRMQMLRQEVYPIFFVWKTDFWSTLTNILADALRRRQPERQVESPISFARDRLDEALEPLARTLTGKWQWDEMKENGILATKNEEGAGRIVLRCLDDLFKMEPELEIHLVAHSAGGIFLAPLVQLLTTDGRISTGPMTGKSGYGHLVKTCSLWAPAITIELFKQTYLPAIASKQMEHFSLFTLTDQAEQDDHCANLYGKSLLYLVSNAFEERLAIPLLREGEPLLGMQKFVAADTDLQQLFNSKRADWILAPNTNVEAGMASNSTSHGAFDNDEPTLKSTLQRITGAAH